MRMGFFILGMGVQAALILTYACCVASGRAARLEEQRSISLSWWPWGDPSGLLEKNVRRPGVARV